MSLKSHSKKNEKIKELLKEINKMSLKERKFRVIKELENKSHNLEELKKLLLMDNTNEELLYRYMQSLDKSDVFYELQKYSNYISLSKINKLQLKFLGNYKQGYRNFSYKDLFFKLLSAIQKDEQNIYNTIIEIISIIDINERNTEMNNQPFDLDNNFEAFYFHICRSLKNRIKEEKKRESTDFKDYLSNLQNYIDSLSHELNIYEKNESEEKNDIKKFLIIVYSLINFDNKNVAQISQVPKIFKEPSDEKINQMISFDEEEIKISFGKKAVNDFKRKNINKKIVYTIRNIGYSNGKIEIPEECYLYDYIINNNVFKKYEKKIIDLLNIIYKSDLIRQLAKIIYKTEENNMKYYFEEDNFVEDFWNKNIIFVPFKIKKVSGLSYKDTFKVFFSIYKIRYFDSETEDEIFTLGAFVRVLIHETLGQLMISYIFYMFYANENKYKNCNTPRITSQMKELNKKNIGEYIGNILAKIFYDTLDETKQKNLLYLSESKESKIKFDNFLEKKLFEKFELIIGKEYADKLIKKIEQIPEIQFSKKENESDLSKLSKQLVDILISLISEELDIYIASLNYKQEKYEEFESGNFVEFLLFNDFSQNMTLKDCLFLLNEKNYHTNFFKFRSEFKNLIGKNNDDFLKELNDGQKIFFNLFEEYISIYEKTKNVNNDLNSPQSFRGKSGNNLNKKFEAFQCFNYGRNMEDLMKKHEVNSVQ